MRATAANYTDDVIWTDPDGTTQGRHALNERAQKLLDRSPDLRRGPVHFSRDLGLLAFNGAAAGGQTDVALVRDGRIAHLRS